eukprot:Seg1794.4 transcript_id=Seg1794.4/GoldUCD/mRNA.D3Y31 product="hypothetical protein" protein_id=Seg1794.4/GoldUCD/D3Y31
MSSFTNKCIELNYVNLIVSLPFTCGGKNYEYRRPILQYVRKMRRSKKVFRPALLPVKVRDGKTNRFITKRHYIRTNGKQPKRHSEVKNVRQQVGPPSPCWVPEDDDDTMDTPERVSSSISKYENRKLKEYRGWESIRDSLAKKRIESCQLPNSTLCVYCEEISRSEPMLAVCRCTECGPDQYYCLSCAVALHCTRNRYHILEKWKDDTFVPLYVNDELVVKKEHSKCHLDVKFITCIDYLGRQHEKMVGFCNCESNAATLVSLGLWPGSPTNPIVAFSIKFMDICLRFLLEAHVSLNKFCDAMSVFQTSLLPKYVKNIYSVLNSGSFDAYRMNEHTMKNLEKISEANFTECPLCPQPNESGSVIESMDGCFGLVRKRHARLAIAPPLHRDSLFADQADVDNFIQGYSKDKQEAESNCHQFKSGEVTTNLRSKGRNKLFEEKGVFGRVCRHDYPRGFFSVLHGERIGYAVYAMEELLRKYKDNQNITIYLMYDIACKLKSHLLVNHQQHLLHKVTLAIPIFHCYGHKMACQVLFNPRRMTGFGLTDGEGVERLWAYLRPFTYMTKEMVASRRVDILTDALYHYSYRLRIKQGKTLAEKLSKCAALKYSTRKQLNETIAPFKGMISAQLINAWSEKEMEEAREFGKHRDDALTWEQRYAKLLWEYHQQRTILSSRDADDMERSQEIITKIKRLEVSLRSREKERNLKRRWQLKDRSFGEAMLTLETIRRNETLAKLDKYAVERRFLCLTKNKYADGQSIAIRLSKQITRTSNAMKNLISTYNAHLSSVKEYINVMSNQLKFDDLKDPSSLLYQSIASNNRQPNNTEIDVPQSEKRKIIDMHNLLEQCNEEEKMLKSEIKKLFHYHITIIETLDKEIRYFAQSNSLSIGKTALLKMKKFEIENYLISNSTLFEDTFVDMSSLSVHESDFIQADLRFKGGITRHNLLEEETESDQFEPECDENELVVDQDPEWSEHDEEGENEIHRDWLVYESETDIEHGS